MTDRVPKDVRDLFVISRAKEGYSQSGLPDLWRELRERIESVAMVGTHPPVASMKYQKKVRFMQVHKRQMT